MRAESVRVSFGCLLHDIGKPVLRAGGQAGDHSSLGYAYLKKLWQDDRDILDCVRLHHAAALRAAQPADSSMTAPVVITIPNFLMAFSILIADSFTIQN